MNPDMSKKMVWDNLVLFHLFDVCREQWPSSKTSIHPESELAKYLVSLANVRNQWITRRIQIQNKIAKQYSTVVCLASVSLNRILVLGKLDKLEQLVKLDKLDKEMPRKEDKKQVKWTQHNWKFNVNPSMTRSRFITDPEPETYTTTETLCDKLVEFLQLTNHHVNTTFINQSLDQSQDKSLLDTTVVKIEPDKEPLEKLMNDPWLQTHTTNNAQEDYHVECALMISTFDSLVRFHVQHAIKSTCNIGELWHNFLNPESTRLDELTSAVTRARYITSCRIHRI